MKNTNKPRIKNCSRENIDLFIQKISEARLIGYQGNTPTRINDLITEKAKGEKNLDMGLSGFIRSKDNSYIASKITKSYFVPTTAEKRFKKNDEKNKSIILPQQKSVNYCISWNIAMSFISISFLLL